MTVNDNQTNPFCLWLNGPSDKDRSTLAALIQQTLIHRGVVTELLDAARLADDIGFKALSPRDMLNLLTWTANLLFNHGITVVMALESGDSEERARIKSGISGLFEVSLGSSHVPDDVNLMLDPGTESVKDCLARILRALELLGFAPLAEDGGYSEKEAEMVAQRLKELGYI